jgi:hypothetical protein
MLRNWSACSAICSRYRNLGNRMGRTSGRRSKLFTQSTFIPKGRCVASSLRV